MRGVFKAVSDMVNGLPTACDFAELHEKARTAGVVNNRRQLSNALYALAEAGEIHRVGKGRSAQYGPGKERAAGKVHPQNAKTAAQSGARARWALTSDGAFMLLGTEIEIPRLAARTLVDFVRVLDEGAA